MSGGERVSYLSTAILSVMGMAGATEVRGSPHPRSTLGPEFQTLWINRKETGEENWPVHRALPSSNFSLPGEINYISTASNSADDMWLKPHTGFWIREHQRASG